MLNPSQKLYRWGPISACPLFMYFTVESAFAPIKKLFDVCYPQSEILFWDNKVLWLLDLAEFVYESKSFTDKNIFDTTRRKRYFSLWTEQNKKLKLLFDRLRTLKLSELSAPQLIDTYRKFATTYYDWNTVTMSLELVTVTLEPMLGERLKKLFTQTTAKEYTRVFSILTSPLVLTFYRQEQRDLLTILTLPKEQQRTALQIHQQHYYWIYNSYFEGKILDTEYFSKELHKSGNTEYKKSLNEIKAYPQSMKKLKESIYSMIHPDDEFLDLVSLIETFSALQDERKKYQFMAEHFLELFVKEFSHRSGVDISLLKQLVLHELADVLKKPISTRLMNRKICFVIDANEKEIIHYDGTNAKALANQYLETTNIHQTVIGGTVASVGASDHFRGKARIILTIKEIGKIHEGDILVTTMTSPDFVIGIKKAGAIITDAGGMLCHAAIVSREFKKPCIVGTEIATKVIHDGNIVELDCQKGTIKILKK
jgi:phosphohistidine swiveling domain-containing protein